MISLIIFLVILGWFVNYAILKSASKKDPNGIQGAGPAALVFILVPWGIPALWLIAKFLTTVLPK